MSSLRKLLLPSGDLAMGLNKGMTQKLGVAGVVIYVTLRSLSAFSADDTSSTTLGGTQITQLPPSFDPSVYQGMSNMFNDMNSCMNLKDNLTQLGDIAVNGAKGVRQQNPNAECGNPDEMGDIPDSCSYYSKKGTDENPEFLRILELSKLVTTNATCKRDKLATLNKELSCLYTQAGALKAQINALNESYKNNIQKVEADHQKIVEQEEDRKSQMEFLNARLNDDKESGKKGLRNLEKETKAMIAAMGGEILAAKEKFKEVSLMRTQMEEFSAGRTMELTNRCFVAEPNSAFRCKPNGPPVSAKDYVLCRYEQNQRLGKNGQVETGSSVAQTAQSNRLALESILNGVIADSAQMNENSGRDASGQNIQLPDKPVSIRSYDDLKSQLGNRLSPYNGNGLDIQSFVLEQYKRCYASAESKVAKEKTQAKSTLGKQRESLNAAERANKSMVNDLLEKYTQQYNDNINGLTGAHIPLDASQCKNATPERQANCLEEFQKNMQGLYNGTSTNSQMNLTIPAKTQGLAINFTCQGIKGCLTKMEAAFTAVKTEKEKVSRFKQQYVLSAKKNFQNFTSTMARTLSGQSSELRSRLQNMGNTLKKLGIKPLRVKDVEGEKQEYDENTGLPKMPNNVLAMVGSQMNPKMPDLDSDQFKEELDDVVKEGKKFEEKVVKASNVEAKILNKKSECERGRVSKANEELESMLERFQDCPTYGTWCEGQGYTDKSEELTGDWKKIQEKLYKGTSDEDSGFDAGMISSENVDLIKNILGAGMATNCRDAITRKKPKENERDSEITMRQADRAKSPACASISNSVKRAIESGGSSLLRGSGGSKASAGR